LRFKFTGIPLIFLALSLAAPAQQKNAKSPSGRIDYAIAYVPFLRGVLMYGGWAPPNWIPTNETWVWDGQMWTRSLAKGAPDFAHHTMAFDSERNVVVVCGRPTPHEGGEYQIWEFDGKAWTRRDDVPVSASALGDPKLTYDTRRKHLVLYVASYNGDAEVWESEGKQWQRIKFTHRPLRCDDNGCQFQYDERLQKAVLVGEDRTAKEPLAWDGKEWGMTAGSGTQTWLWDGSDWTQLHGAQPPKAMWGGMTFDRSRHRMILLTTRMETWTLRHGDWVKLRPPRSPTPAPNGFFELAFDPTHKVSLFFGGENRQGEAEKDWNYPEKTWLYDGRNWVSK